MENEILDLYFEKGLKPIDIANKLNIKQYQITRILQKDTRYKQEKELRKTKNKEKHKEYTKEYIKQQRKEIVFSHKVDDLTLKNIHNQASAELSKRNHLTNENYRKWNYSAYKYNPSKHRYEFDDCLRSIIRCT